MTKSRPQLELHRELQVRAAQLLSDGQWRPYTEIAEELMKLIPPGVAIRRTEKMRQKPAKNPPAERVVPRDIDKLIRTGRRNFVGELLRNHRIFEVDKRYPTGARPTGWVDDRRIRMIAVPKVALPPGMRATRVGRRFEVEKERDRLLDKNEHLRDQIANLRIYLIGLGHEDRANEIAPPNEDDEERTS